VSAGSWYHWQVGHLGIKPSLKLNDALPQGQHLGTQPRHLLLLVTTRPDLADDAVVVIPRPPATTDSVK
jgi:hypothetical protein